MQQKINSEILDVINTTIKSTENKIMLFKSHLNKAEKQVLAKDFQSNILSILDYIYTNYPTDRKLLWDYFPRPKSNESKKTYIENNNTFRKKKTKTKHPKSIIILLNKFYDIHEKYNKAISNIHSKVKHETPNNFNIERKSRLDYNITTNHPNPVKINWTRIELPWIVFDNCSNIKLENCTLLDWNTTTHIEFLNITEIEVVGDDIIFFSWEKRNFYIRALDCINICKETLNLVPQ